MSFLEGGSSTPPPRPPPTGENKAISRSGHPCSGRMSRNPTLRLDPRAEHFRIDRNWSKISISWIQEKDCFQKEVPKKEKEKKRWPPQDIKKELLIHKKNIFFRFRQILGRGRKDLQRAAARSAAAAWFTMLLPLLGCMEWFHGRNDNLSFPERCTSSSGHQKRILNT